MGRRDWDDPPMWIPIVLAGAIFIVHLAESGCHDRRQDQRLQALEEFVHGYSK